MELTTSAYRPAPVQWYIAREGFPFIAIALIAAFVSWLAGFAAGCIFMSGIAVFAAFFFRNPDRAPPVADGIIVSPADGRVLDIKKTKSPYSGNDSLKISIFMSVLNVHINRFPAAATVEKVVYHPGKFFVASFDKASEFNERNGMVLSLDCGRRIEMVQIAGIVARRIISYVKEGDFLPQGERFGLIRFGSRVDLYLPTDTTIEVKAGERVRGGKTIVGRFA